MPDVRFEIADCPPGAVAALCRELGVSEALAQVLVRRGFQDTEDARRFLAAEEENPTNAMSGIERAAHRTIAAISSGERITIHGDYDVDGLSATALLLRALRRLGGQVDWHIPQRAEGYGLREEAVREIARRGTTLLITVDCGITSVEEVALAGQLGIETIVTDHHAPRADGALPQAIVVHPTVCSYPCADLCGAAVAYKLALAVWDAAGRDPAELDGELDLVGLATIADVVPLRGENRTLARRGMRAIATTSRPGLRALMAVASVDPSRVDERALGFALAPRINAAGRLHSAAAALELLLTADEARAKELASELDRCNHERREVEQRILFEAEAQLRELGPQSGYVLAGEGWHHGVIGIVAARLAERHHRPVVLIALDGGSGRGSGRSIPSFDLLAGLTACEAHLRRYGGHRAAAGLEIERDRIPEMATTFAAHAAAVLGEEDLVPVERVDAIVSGPELGLDLAEELRSLAPFGHGNPSVSLMLRGCDISDLQAMGEGRHARFRIADGGVHAKAVAFGVDGGLRAHVGTPLDATFKLEVNEWRGVTEPRLVLRRLAPHDPSLLHAREPERRTDAREPARQTVVAAAPQANAGRAAPRDADVAQTLQMELSVP